MLAPWSLTLRRVASIWSGWRIPTVNPQVPILVAACVRKVLQLHAFVECRALGERIPWQNSQVKFFLASEGQARGPSP